MENEFVINIGTVNGSGSQSANLILMRSLFNMGIPVGGKNVFPSNIAGLPTWFWIRASEQGYTGRRANADIVVAMNAQTMTADMKSLKAGGVFIYNSDLGQITEVPGASQVIGIPFKTLVDEVTDQIKVKKMVINIIYVGVLIQLLEIDEAKADAALVHQLGGKQSVLDINRKGLQRGIQYVRENLAVNVFPFKAKMSNKTAGKMLIDGNSSAALGAVMGGCTFASWYPITPASSLMEEFIRISNHYRVNEEGRSTAAIVQAEDELAAICMVLGAGWAGARAMTATSGPGLSLMQEAAGYAYYTEIPAVVWDVQRTGPSTGMPTRTMQGDLLSAHFASHGDTQFPMLIPGNPTECFTMAQDALDLAERMQTLVFVMSDLDIGMNLWMVDRFQYPEKPYDRGKVLSPEVLKQATNYERYGNPDGDGIPWRSLPGNAAGAYTIRGS
ncbi:MAG TPA: 2-oxoacid:acceptor oxidoreductase family protein, partial [Pseudobdellovibrionaceae bacterium]|nr:2-oxoacid:acceptor oxidoreductase family protein [Pseudobdellovibrionaceae bacterium]